jgi:glycosyltransferase involved in cell wall biosynthesis
MALRLLHVLQSVDPAFGGPIEGVRQLAVAHRKYQHSLEIISNDPPGAAHLSFPGVPVYPLRLTWWDRYLFPFSLFHWLRAHACLYDAVIINGIWCWHIFAVRLALLGRRTPYFVFTHGMLDPWFRRRYPLKHLKKWLVWPWAIYPVLCHADAVFFTCEQEKILARQSFWLYDCNEVVVAYGTAGIPSLSTDYAGPFLQRHPQIGDRRRLLFFGRVHPKKGPDLLLHALADLKEEGLWNPATTVLVMAGPATGAYAEQLRALARKRGISDSVVWTGMLTGDDKWGALQCAEAFVLPSHQENFGIAVTEALSCSTPVLITHAVNIAPEIAADGAGFVEADTLPGTRTLLMRWLQLAPQARAALRPRARQCFENRYCMDNFSSSITREIYLSLFQRRFNHHGLNL